MINLKIINFENKKELKAIDFNKFKFEKRLKFQFSNTFNLSF